MPQVRVNFGFSSSEFQRNVEMIQATMKRGFSMQPGRRFGKTAASRALMECYAKRDVLAAFRRGAWR